VSGRYLPGVFAGLSGLKPGDVFTIQYGDMSERRFKVKRSVSVTVAAANSQLYEQDPGIKAQLNLITCTGSYDAAGHGYGQRLIVVAERIL
jgi:sortase (surface protein transpeptidase)